MLNVVALQGRLTADPELKHTTNDIPVVSFTVAVDRNYSQGEKKADFIRVKAWRSTAEFIEKYFTKGQMIVVEGAIETGQYEDKEGNKRNSFEVVASHAHFASSKFDSNGASNPNITRLENTKEIKTYGSFEDFGEDQDADSELPF